MVSDFLIVENCSLFQTHRELSMNKKNLQALTLVGPTRQTTIPDTLTILHLNNQECILFNLSHYYKTVPKTCPPASILSAIYHTFANTILVF